MGRRVLIIDDSEIVRSLVREALADEGSFDTFHIANDGIEGLQVLRDNEVDVVVCDVIMPDMDGLKFLLLKSQQAAFRDVPVIMLTGNEDIEAKLECLAAGAQDFVTKPFDDKELVARVKVHVQIRELQRELVTKNDKLEELSNTDDLTGIANRRAFMRELSAEFARADRYEHPLSYVMLDIDFFKRINDDYGHQVGDEALRHVCKLIQTCLRTPDLLGRYGGEEFGLLLPQTTLQNAVSLAERCRSLIEKTPLVTGEGAVKITVSVGVALFPGDGVKTVDDLIKAADKALYRAKEAGRNRVQSVA